MSGDAASERVGAIYQKVVLLAAGQSGDGCLIGRNGLGKRARTTARALFEIH